MPTFNDARVRIVNPETTTNRKGDYVLYWMQASRRLDRNHALDYALHRCRGLGKPLVIYEGLRLDYPWASARLHRFMLDGMIANARQAADLGINYWPYVETPEQPARGLLRKLSTKACLVVTDDYPAFIVPAQTAALAAKTTTPVIAVEGNGLVPLALLGETVSACAHLRPRIHRLFAEAWAHRAAATPAFESAVKTTIEPPFSPWRMPAAAAELDAFIAGLPVDASVKPVAGVIGGNDAGRSILDGFLRSKLARYAEERNHPDDPRRNASSGLSAYLRHGHLSIQEIVEKTLSITGPWTPDRLNPSSRGKRQGYYHPDPNVNSFLDEAITWRDVGYHWHYTRMRKFGLQAVGPKTLPGWKHPLFQDLESTLPAWAMKALRDHAIDQRDYVYTLEEWENADTHDELWNAAQQELLATGRIHNYLRMLWGKKVLEWSATPQEAYAILEHLNNKYALDGRDPNSYTGILWCFGLFDRPWPPERKVFGTVRYMSSQNTAKKYDVERYYTYVRGLMRQ